MRNLDFGREVEIPVRYKGEQIGTKRIDFIVEDVLLEIKATSVLQPEHYVQALSYPRASGRRIGLLLNFGGERVQYKRLIRGYDIHAGGPERPLDG